MNNRNLKLSVGRCIPICSVLLLLFSGAALGSYKADIGHTALAIELGAAVPSGSGVKVTQAEEDSTNDDPNVVITYSPDPGDAEFAGKNIVDVTATSTAYSGHATAVATFLFGNSQSIAPGITMIDIYLADDWLAAGLLRAGQSGPGPKPQPGISSGRIANHSWVHDSDDDAVDSDTLRRFDWVIERDEFIQIVGVKNSGVTQPLLSTAYNAISVGRTDGVHATGTVSVDAIYTANRTRPDIVAPAGVTSVATPMVAAGAALLIETGHDTPGLSTDPVSVSTINRNGDLIYNAERAETTKSALMAGAERATSNTTAADLSDYRADIANQTDNGLDMRFGAGQLNIYNSYNIIAAGEHNSIEDAASTGGQIGNSGFDYDPSFGGDGGSNNTASYFFSTGADAVRLAASLVWNIKIDGGSMNDFDGAATVYGLDLFLYDMTGAASENDWQLVGSSESQIENSENLWLVLD
ncbi:MAG: hypothetical protein OEQ74_06625, partial [Gammaproteobacteria bacterium]|nr:hypothetical protein [Gammaproteobacteria bacterium]